jgi:DNA invertase Pin-like site-specific DNA recombinase
MTGKVQAARGNGSARKAERATPQVIELIRVSTHAQAEEDKYGIPAQKEECARIALRNGLEIKWTFQIEGVSGKDLRRSDKMRELLKIVRSGQCDGIVMREFSRIMRKVDSDLMDILEEHKVKLYCPDMVIDFAVMSQKLLAQLQGAFGEYERAIIRERMISGKFAKRRRGEWASGKNTVPLGLELVQEGNRSVLKVGAEIERVKDLFDKFIEGGGFTPFQELARKTGINYKSVAYILQNELYTGYHVPKKRVNPTKNEYWEDGSLRYQRCDIIPVEERERIKMLDGKPPISETTFAQAQRLLALRREMRVKVKSDSEEEFLYRGLLRCAECGRKLITLKYSNKDAKFYEQYYVCIGAHGSRRTDGTWRIKNGSCPTRRIRRALLEPILDEKIATKLGSLDYLDQVAKENEEMDKEGSEERMKNLQTEIETAERAIERNHELYVRGKVSSAQFEKLDEQLQLELKAAKVALEKVRPIVGRITVEMWKPIAAKFRKWKRLDLATRRGILTAMGATFFVAGYAGPKYHQTIIKVTGWRIDLSGRKGEGGDGGPGEIYTEIEDGPGLPVLVPIDNQPYSDRDRNQSSIYLTL